VPNAQRFAKRLVSVGALITRGVNVVVTETGKEVRRSVAERTPVLSGRAQAGWNLSVGTADTRVKGESYSNPSNSVDAGNVNVRGFRLGQDLLISNSTHYIDDLNAGSSKKAPAGFVEMTVANLGPIVARAVFKAKRLI